MSRVTAGRPFGKRAAAFASIVVVASVAGVSRAAGDGDVAPSRVTAVTVHLQHAVVTRELKVDLVPGEQRFAVRPLPAGIEPESVRVRGEGAPGLLIRGVEVRSVHEDTEVGAETRTLQDEIRELTRRQTLALERIKSIGVLRGLVADLKAATVETGSRDLVTRGFATADWERAFAFVSTHLDALADEEQRLARDNGDLARSLETARARLAETASQRAPDRYAVEIVVSAQKGGTARLSVTYLVADASWRPLYDARLDPVLGRVTIDALGQITQTTGEDWTDAAITLTTSQPLAGIDLPRLASVRLVDSARQRAQGGFTTVAAGSTTTETKTSSTFIDALPILARNYQDVLTLSAGLTEGDGNPSLHGARGADVRAPIAVPAQMAAMDVVRGDVMMVFAIPGRLDIPSDGQPHQHLIASRDVGARVEYHCVPAISPQVFVVARLTLPDDLPLLAGRMAHFVDGDLVGRSTVAARSGGEEMTLSFGPEMHLRAERRDTLLKTGRRGRDEERDRKVVTTLRNFLGRPITVHLSDRVPVSGDDRIEVAVDRDDTTAALPGDPREPGILKWDLALPAAGRADVTLRYRIRAPAGMLPAEP